MNNWQNMGTMNNGQNMSPPNDTQASQFMMDNSMMDMACQNHSNEMAPNMSDIASVGAVSVSRNRSTV
jgi:hypothetical protein